MATQLTPATQPHSQHPAWKELEAHYQQIRHVHLRTLFAQDHERGDRFAAEAVGVPFE